MSTPQVTALRNGRVITPEGEVNADLYLAGGTIVGIGNLPQHQTTSHSIDVAGKYVVPGFIDGHVHLREMGNSDREDFYTGTQDIWTWSALVRASYRLSTQLDYQKSDADLREGSFTTHLGSLRTDYAFNPKMSLSALIQYNSDTDQVSSNIRFRLIHHPLSDFYVVYNDQRETKVGISDRKRSDRSLTFKYTHLLNF